MYQVGPDTELSTSELLTLSCGVLFFLSFFVAMYVEVKAEFTIYQVENYDNILQIPSIWKMQSIFSTN